MRLGKVVIDKREPETDAVSLRERVFRKVIELDRDFAAAYALAARCYGRRKANRWMIDPSQEAAEATRLARQAIEKGPDDAVALCNAAWVLDHIARDTHAGVVFIDRARALNPNLATAWLASGWARFHLTDFDVAIEHFARATRCRPARRPHISAQAAARKLHRGRSGRCARTPIGTRH